MGKPAVSLRNKLISLCAAALLTCGLAPSLALADDSEPAGFTPAHEERSGDAERSAASAAIPNSSTAENDDGAVLASTLANSTSAVISAVVTLDTAEPLIGSFMVDGLTYSVSPDGLALVSVDPSAVSDGAITIPASVAYNGQTYSVTSIASYAFYLSNATNVVLPASVSSVDGRAFRSSDVGSVSVAAGNPNFASFDGALYSADLTRLLLIPEGKKGSVLLSCETEVAEPSVFSHCSLVDAISVEEGGAAFSSWNGLLYDASGTTLLRVPAGATEITIRAGCTTIAAGALEGCANLERIHAPASVTSISPDVFTSIPTITLPAQSVLRDEENPGVASALADQSNVSTDFIPQLTALVTLASVDDALCNAESASIEAILSVDADASVWLAAGFSIDSSGADTASSVQQAMVYAADEVVGKLNVSAALAASDGLSMCAPGSYNYGLFNEGTSGTVVCNGEIVPLTAHGYYYELKQLANSTGFTLYWIRSGSYNAIGIGEHYWGGITSAYAVDQGGARGQYLSVGTRLYRDGTAVIFLNGAEKPIITWDANGGTVERLTTTLWWNNAVEAPLPERERYRFKGWFTAPEGGTLVCGDAGSGGTTPKVKRCATYYAQWELDDYILSFDTSSEPGDESCPGDAKLEQIVNVGDGQAHIEDPTRSGYVFQGWVPKAADGTLLPNDRVLLGQSDDGSWYVNASKLPDYADGEGRVELTARWTSVISVDVPQSVTFFADPVTQGQGPREGEVVGIFGQSATQSHSPAGLRLVGLESHAAAAGAESALKKAGSSVAGKLLSLYPSAKQWTADDLQDPDLAFGAKPATAVDFDLDDLLLEASFPADSFTIPAGGTLNLGYRLNLEEAGYQLNYDALSTLEDGQSVSIATITYCFATA